ncbi:MAG: DUF2339 domain-containing protein [Saccharospirillum sp.]
MDGEILFFTLLALALVIGALLGWLNFFSLRTLRREVAELRDQLAQSPNREPSRSLSDAPKAEVNTSAELSQSGVAEAASAVTAGAAEPEPSSTVEPDTPDQAERPPKVPAWWAHLQQHWMVWLGAVSIGLAGVFLAVYSIEQGLLGPAARIALGLVTGVALHLAAEWLRRRSQAGQEALAGLAGGASLVLYAALLAALHLYQLWPPGLVFALLALVSLGTLVLSLWYGPILAVLGLVGAYAVPLLLGGSSEDLRPLLVYSLIIAGSGFWLLRHVVRPWLVWVVLGGALGWWALILMADTNPAWLGLYLALLGYGLLAIPSGNGGLRDSIRDEPPARTLVDFLRLPPGAERFWVLGLGGIILAQAVTLFWRPQWSQGPWIWLPLVLLVLLASWHNERLKLLPWWLALTSFSAILGTHWQPGDFAWQLQPTPDNRALLAVLAMLAVLFSLWGFAFGRHSRYPALALSLATMAPLGALALAWLLTDEWLNRWAWSGFALLMGVVYVGKGQWRWRQVADAQVVWWLLAGHLAYALTVVISLSQASLTLALAAQVVSLSWLQRRFAMPLLDWLTRLVLMVIIARLTLNPWLLDYSGHPSWSLWTYGGSLVLVALARWQCAPQTHLRLWLEGALAHLLVLCVATFSRYWLYDGAVFSQHYGFTEASLNTSLWLALGLVYHFRSQLADVSAWLMRLISNLLLLAGVLNYALVVTALNPLWWTRADLASTPIVNGLLLAYGLPVLLFALANRLGNPAWRRGFALLTAFGLWWFVSLQVRHLWHGQLDAADPWLSGELYSYSIAWLVLACGAILTGSWRASVDLYRGGMALLLVVIAKIFIIDMADLDGLLRVLSFMGLGLSLLGLAYLHQRFQRPVPHA